jgi:hypothetical protein
LVTAAASAGVLALPIGACRIGHLRFSFSVRVFTDHMRISSPVSLPGSYRASSEPPKHRVDYIVPPACVAVAGQASSFALSSTAYPDT